MTNFRHKLSNFQTTFSSSTLDTWYPQLVAGESLLTKCVGEKTYKSYHMDASHILLCQAKGGKAEQEGNSIEAKSNIDLADKLLNLLKARIGGIIYADSDYETELSQTIYFLSYARTNSARANQVELQLLRENKKVWRDETDIRGGAQLVNSLYSGINEAHTFICLLSQQYVQSNWCMEEIERAIYRKIDKGTPRVIALRIDDFPVPPSIETRVWLDARNPEKLQLAVSKIMREEQKTG